jgi:hypothetical protein
VVALVAAHTEERQRHGRERLGDDKFAFLADDGKVVVVDHVDGDPEDFAALLNGVVGVHRGNGRERR